ncbi:2,3-dihydro-2,3-dihydroxybenzoate dehydrogenase [Puniceibacterium sediminis]|uniref:2,3-dihydro-2,3-dihydroxybenzoate dehydrogenase n=1 Tax=Puniceibacterium sediminis TaxID=1608407 RepID=A0A238ZGR2_9RHOB|nr:2,3-dihydro-2,3-dihydroxybenzoate dehydrogenase [Puniceibacterium sediminis]SNR82537.1 2,3-dihydro-2,3-dihydroxybenzoate dehydrogenase [Puniceibacterium sediminis]
MQLTGFEGKIALVTGAGGGIGRAVITALREAGTVVIATDLAEALSGMEPDAGLHIRPLDVTDGAAVRALVEEVEGTIGPVDMFVGLAAILSTSAVKDLTVAEWRRVFDVNMLGTFLITQALAAHMTARGHGAMVVVSSNAAGIPRTNMAAYGASKAALTMYVRCLGLELAPHGIRCNVVAPGSTLTPMQTGMWADDSGAAAVIAGSLETYKTGIPLKKLATPADIANSVMFLLSEQAGHIAMADLYVDGGATLRG